MAVNYDYYRIFYHAAQCRSFTKAAEELENNQPNITRCMNNLEHELGCKLFARSNRGITLTPEGERLYMRVSVAYEQLSLGEEELKSDLSLESGTLSICTSENALQLLLLEKLTYFHAKYPGVRLRITNDSTPQSVAALSNGQADCAVVTTPDRVGKSMKVTRLLTFRDVLICGSQYRWLAEKVRSLKELETLSFISMRRSTLTYKHYQRLFAKYDMHYQAGIEVNTADQVLQMVRANLGIGFYAEKLAAPVIASGEVYQIRLAEYLPDRSISLVEDASRPQSVTMKSFRDVITEHRG